MELSRTDPALPAAAMATHALNPGTILKSRFQIVRDLGQGAFGSTYLASDLDRFETSCTIKQLRLDESADQERLASLFKREARQLFSLGRQRHIPEFLGYFQDHGGHYLAYDYIDGDNLSLLLGRRDSWTNEEVAELWSTMISTLAHIHSLGIIHRDIKPSNIIKNRDSLGYTLIDFGASILHPAERGTLIGTPGYTPLRQLVQGVSGPESDRHALAMTLIHVLTGLSPSSLFGMYGPNLQGLWLPSVLVLGVSHSLLYEIDSALMDQIGTLTVIDTAKQLSSAPSLRNLADAKLPVAGNQVSSSSQGSALDPVDQPVSGLVPPMGSSEISTVHDFTSRSFPLTSSQSSLRPKGHDDTTRLEGRRVFSPSRNEKVIASTRTIAFRWIGLLIFSFVAGSGFISSLLCQGSWYCLASLGISKSNIGPGNGHSVENQVQQALTLAVHSRGSADMSSMLRAHFRLNKLHHDHHNSMNATLLSRVSSEMIRLKKRFTVVGLLDYADGVIVEARSLRKRPKDLIDHETYQSLLVQLSLARDINVGNLAITRSLDQIQADLVPPPSSVDSSVLVPQQTEPNRPNAASPPDRQAYPVIKPFNNTPPSSSVNYQPPPRAPVPPRIEQPMRSAAPAPQSEPSSGASSIYIEPVQGGPF
jgi:serine/threonine protein kinase